MRKSQNLDSNRFVSLGWKLEKSLPRKRGETVAQLLRESPSLEMFHSPGDVALGDAVNGLVVMGWGWTW